MKDFSEIINDGHHYLFDGAIGTELYKFRVHNFKIYEELNLSNPDMVMKVHLSYKDAGAQILTTNTYASGRYILNKYGLGHQVKEINIRGVEIARNAAKNDLWVAASIGQLGLKIQPYGNISKEQVYDYFSEQIKYLIEGGPDAIILETFTNLEEIEIAIKAVKEHTNLPIIAMMTIQLDGKTIYGTTSSQIAKCLDQWGADVIGLNCSVGPTSLLDAVIEMAKMTKKPLITEPNAGFPVDIQERKTYVSSPDYMAKYAGLFMQEGVKFIGGCCGTGPEHIHEMYKAIRAIEPHKKIIIDTDFEQKNKDDTNISSMNELSSRLARHIRDKNFVVSVELLPPQGCDPSQVLEKAQFLKDHGVHAINLPDGPRAQSRMNPIAMGIIIQQKLDMEVIIHYCCRDRNLLGIQSDLLGATVLGIKNLLVITGDPPKMGNLPDSTAVFDIDSIGLTHLVTQFNKGKDMSGNSIGKGTDYFIGVGVNPGAIDLDREISRFEKKVIAGAHFAITQPVFDIKILEKFLMRITDIKLPILAGIWPLFSFRNAEFLNNEIPEVSIPEEIMNRMKTAQEKGKEAATEEGLIIATELGQKIRSMIQGLQISAPFGRVELAVQLFKNIQ